jgi:hypothetical protein
MKKFIALTLIALALVFAPQKASACPIGGANFAFQSGAYMMPSAVFLQTQVSPCFNAFPSVGFSAGSTFGVSPFFGGGFAPGFGFRGGFGFWGGFRDFDDFRFRGGWGGPGFRGSVRFRGRW